MHPNLTKLLIGLPFGLTMALASSTSVAAAEPFLVLSSDKAAPGDTLTLTYDISKGGCEWGGELSVYFDMIDVDSPTPIPLAAAPLFECVAFASVTVPPFATSASRTVIAYIADPLGQPIAGTEASAILYVN